MSAATVSREPKSTETSATDIGRWQHFWLLLLVPVAPMMVPYFTNLWSRETYRFFPFAILAVGVLTYSRWNRQFRAPRGMLNWLAIAVGLGLNALGIFVGSPWLCAVAMILLAASFFASSMDSQNRPLTGLVLPLLMIVNLPLGYDQLLTIRLQQITTGLASVMLDLLAIPHAVSNNVIQLTTRELFVAEACSGIQSVFTLMFLSTLLVAIYRRPVWLAPIYLAIASLLAVAANVLRVTTVAVGDVWLGVDLADGWPHEVVGYTALGLGTLFLLSFDHLVTTLLHPVDPVVEGENNLLITAWNFLVGDEHRKHGSRSKVSAATADSVSDRVSIVWQQLWSRRLLIGLFSVLGIAAIAQAVNLQQPVPVFVQPTEVIYQPPANAFDRTFSMIEVSEHERTRGGSNPRLGENADVWTCVAKDGSAEIQVVLSQPYAGWHELCICYEINAWLLLNREIRGSGAEQSEETGTMPYALARFKNADGRFAYLVYSAVDEVGTLVEPPPRPGRLGNRFMEYLGREQGATNRNVMMLQMFIVSREKLTPETLRTLAADFVEMRSIIQQGVIQSHAATEQPSPSASDSETTLREQEA